MLGLKRRKLIEFSALNAAENKKGKNQNETKRKRKCYHPVALN